jgi:hypothetical protein
MALYSAKVCNGVIPSALPIAACCVVIAGQDELLVDVLLLLLMMIIIIIKGQNTTNMLLLIMMMMQKLFFCEYSLHFFKRRSQLMRHLAKCKLRHPPGDEIYRRDNVSMFEVKEGSSQSTRCIRRTMLKERHAEQVLVQCAQRAQHCILPSKCNDTCTMLVTVR